MLTSFEGVVLFTRSHREHDLLVKIFTRAYGTRMFFVRRGQKTNHPLQSQLIPLTYNRYIGQINDQGLSFIQEAETLHFNRQIQMDYLKQAYTTYLMQLIDAALDDQEVAPSVYDLCVTVLDYIEKDHLPLEVITTYVEIYLLRHFGTSLEWQRCVYCGQVKEPWDFSVRLGGLLCPDHYVQDDFRLKMSGRAMHIAYSLANLPLNKIRSVNLSQESKKELRRLMDEIYQEFVGIRLKARSYLNQLFRLDQLIEANLLTRKENESPEASKEDL